MRVPDENVMVEASAQYKIIVGIPVKWLHARVVSFEWSAWFEIFHAPQTDFAIEASRGEKTQIWDR